MEWNIIVGMICTLIGSMIGYATFSRNKAKDDKATGQQDGVVLTELGYIKGSVDGLGKKLDRQEERNTVIVERLAKVEASASQAHKRLDRMEGAEHER